ncbi:MAG: thiamine phosphate synthase [Acidobacteriota bacterium]
MPAACLALVTSRRQLSPGARTMRDEWVALDAFLDDALEARVDVIQIREPDVDSGMLCKQVEGLVRRASTSGVRIVVNDRADVALASGAHGVHLPARGLPPVRLRSLMPEAIVGRSMHKDDLPDETGLDYLLFGTVFASRSKPGLKPAGLEALAEVSARSSIPVLAIGGITPARVGACLDAGATGVAAIGAFLPPGRSPDAMGVAVAVQAFRKALSRIC